MPKLGSMRDLIKSTGELDTMQDIQVDARSSLIEKDPTPASIVVRDIAITRRESYRVKDKMHLFTLAAVLSSISLAFALVAAPYATTSVNHTSFPLLLEATLDDLTAGLESNLFTSADLVKAYSLRILEVNSTLHVVTELNPDALAIATHADELRKNGTVLGPLHGIPILIKNNIATGDAMNNTAGSFALLGAKQGDSTIAAKLRKAGAIILGKTNLSQWANFRSNNSTNGWSAYGGQATGAYYPEQDPSGSSSGSGVASSIGLALGALGTETSGSILSPADVSNLVGIKPSVGLTSRHLVIPVSRSLIMVGYIWFHADDLFTHRSLSTKILLDL
jgi:amidase